MNNRERFHAIMNYKTYDRMPVVHFSYWSDTLDIWCAEGHISPEERKGIYDGSPEETAVSARLGFDLNYYNTFQDLSGFTSLFPAFEERIVEERPDGTQVLLNMDGAMVLHKPGGAGCKVGERAVLLRQHEENVRLSHNMKTLVTKEIDLDVPKTQPDWFYPTQTSGIARMRERSIRERRPELYAAQAEHTHEQLGAPCSDKQQEIIGRIKSGQCRW